MGSLELWAWRHLLAVPSAGGRTVLCTCGSTAWREEEEEAYFIAYEWGLVKEDVWVGGREKRDRWTATAAGVSHKARFFFHAEVLTCGGVVSPTFLNSEETVIGQTSNIAQN